MNEAKESKEQIFFTGFIAQEVEQAAKNVGYDFSGVKIPENTETEAYGLCYAEFVVPLVKAVQELNNKVESQEDIIAKQNALLEKYASKYEAMEAKLKSIEAKLENKEDKVNPNLVSKK